MKTTSLTSCVLLGSFLTALHAQTPDDPAQGRALVASQPVRTFDQEPMVPVGAGDRLPSLRTPIHTAPEDLGQAYGIWAAGDTYKASFHDGMTFVPYLGRGYPKTQSLHWRTTSATLGGLELLENTTPSPAQSDYRYEYHFGPLTEAYDVRADGLEQTFVLHQRPAAGDLVIQAAVQSTMTAKNVGPAQQGLVFSDDAGNALVEYGKAVAFDANGVRVPVDTAYADGKITLTVAADWLARAALPVTVDPLLTRVQIAFWGAAADGAVESVDIGRDDDAVTNNIMITYSRSASATDSDAWARLCNEDFSGATVVFTDITTSWDTDQLSCAFVGGALRWVVVMRRYFPNNPTRVSQLRCHAHASADLTLLTSYGSLVPPVGSNEWRADVGGVEAFATGSNALVVFQREDNSASTPPHFSNTALSSVYGCLINATTTPGTFGTAFAIKPSAIHDNERPSVNQAAEGGASFSWICVYQRFIDGATNEDWDIDGARINQSGSVASGTWVSNLSGAVPAQHQLGPIVEGQSGRYAVTFSTVDVASVNFKTGLIAGKQLQVERFDWDNTSAAPSGDQPPVEIRSNADRRWEATGLGYDTNDDSHWCLGFRAVVPGVPALYYTRVGFHGEITEGPSTLLYYIANETPISGACVFNNDSNEFLFGYGVDDGGPAHPVYGHALTYDAPATSSTFGVSCSNESLYWTGNQQIGAEFNRVGLTGAPASALHIMLVATSTVNLPIIHPALSSGCRLFVPSAGPDYLGSFPTGFGASTSWELALPEFLGSQTLHFQDWYLDVNTLLFYSSERLSVPIIK